MAITAKFLADFEAFKASAKSAEDSLKSLEGQGGRLESTFDSMTSLAGKFGIALSVGAAVSFGRAILDDADALTKLHDKTGISVEGLQAMRIAGDDAGVSLEAMTSAVNMLQKRLGGDDASAVQALRDLGIEVEKFKALDGAEQMSAIADAIQKQEDPLRVAADLSALYGKAWAEQLPVLKRGFTELKDGVTGMSTETVAALDKAGDAAGRFWRAFKGAGGEALADVLTLSLSATRREASEMAKELEGAGRAAAAAAPKLEAMAPPGLPDDLDEINQKFNAQAEIINDNMTPAAIAWRKAMEELNSVGLDWRGTLDTIDGTVVEAIKFYEAAGVSQKALAIAYGLTDAQVKSVGSSLRAEADATRDAALEHQRLADAAANAADQLEREREAADKLKREAAAATAAIEALKKANREMGNSTQFDVSTEAGRMAVPEGIRVWLHDGYSLAQAAQIDFLMRWGLPINANDPLFRNKGPRVPGFASGVENFAGGLALVGERGPELVNLPSGSDVIPMGRGGGIVNNFYLIDNSENLARKTAQMILASMKRGKQLGLA